jgi:hypothetical protein
VVQGQPSVGRPGLSILQKSPHEFTRNPEKNEKDTHLLLSRVKGVDEVLIVVGYE